MTPEQPISGPAHPNGEIQNPYADLIPTHEVENPGPTPAGPAIPETPAPDAALPDAGEARAAVAAATSSERDTGDQMGTFLERISRMGAEALNMIDGSSRSGSRETSSQDPAVQAQVDQLLGRIHADDGVNWTNPKGLLQRPPDEAAHLIQAAVERGCHWAGRAISHRLNILVPYGAGEFELRLRASQADHEEELARLSGQGAAVRFDQLRQGQTPQSRTDVHEFLIGLYAQNSGLPDSETQRDRNRRAAGSVLESTFDYPPALEALASYWAQGLFSAHSDLALSVRDADSTIHSATRGQDAARPSAVSRLAAKVLRRHPSPPRPDTSSAEYVQAHNAANESCDQATTAAQERAAAAVAKLRELLSADTGKR